SPATFLAAIRGTPRGKVPSFCVLCDKLPWYKLTRLGENRSQHAEAADPAPGVRAEVPFGDPSMRAGRFRSAGRKHGPAGDTAPLAGLSNGTTVPCANGGSALSVRWGRRVGTAATAGRPGRTEPAAVRERSERFRTVRPARQKPRRPPLSTVSKRG